MASSGALLFSGIRCCRAALAPAATSSHFVAAARSVCFLPPRRWQHSRGEEEETVEEHEKTIYRGIMSTQIKLVKSFSLMTSAIGISCQPFLTHKIMAANGSIAVVAAGGAFFAFFTFATPLLIHWVSKKYVVEMLYNTIDNTYTAVTYSLLLRQKKIKFTPGDVNVPDLPGMFTTFKVSGKPLFIDGDSFESPVHYGRIMGYDKPLNLRWEDGQTEGQARKTKKDA